MEGRGRGGEASGTSCVEGPVIFSVVGVGGKGEGEIDSSGKGLWGL